MIPESWSTSSLDRQGDTCEFVKLGSLCNQFAGQSISERDLRDLWDNHIAVAGSLVPLPCLPSRCASHVQALEAAPDIAVA